MLTFLFATGVMVALLHAALVIAPSTPAPAAPLAQLEAWIPGGAAVVASGWLGSFLVMAVLVARSRSAPSVALAVPVYAAGCCYLLWWSAEVAGPTQGGISASEVLDLLSLGGGLPALIVFGLVGLLSVATAEVRGRQTSPTSSG